MAVLETPLPDYARAYDEWLARKGADLAAARWSRAFAGYPYAVNRTAPLARLSTPLEEARIGLVSTGGVHLAAEAPFDALRPEGDWSLREIPIDAQPSGLRISHRSYDTAWADKDMNVVLPLDRMNEFAEEGETGPFVAAVSLMGSITKVHALVEETLPAVVAALKRAGADAALLVPL